MAHSVCLQDWITISGDNVSIIQTTADWLDTSEYQDVAAYVETSANSSATSTNLDIQSSPAPDAALFAIGSYALRFSLNSGNVGPQAIQFNRFSTTSAQPLSRWTRWMVTFPNLGVATTMTFRIWLTLNPVR